MRKKKSFRKITWIIIIFLIYNLINILVTPPITQAEWIAMLTESFGNEEILEPDEATKPATKEYAVVTAMRALGDNRLNYLTGKEELSDEELIKLAVELDIIPEILNAEKSNEV